MGQYNIFVEGPDDKNFLTDYLDYLGIFSSKFSLKDTGGYTKLHLVEQIFEANTILKTKNLILFDADSDFSSRESEIKKTIKYLGITTDLFLFPDNASAGNLDSILIAISNPTHNSLYHCYDNFCQCLSANSSFKIPGIKDKIYTYIDCLNENPKVGKRNFKNSTLWNLDDRILDRLKQFLTGYIV